MFKRFLYAKKLALRPERVNTDADTGTDSGTDTPTTANDHCAE